MQQRGKLWLTFGMIGWLIGCGHLSPEELSAVPPLETPRPVERTIAPPRIELGTRLVSLILDLAPMLAENYPALFLNTSLPFTTFLGRCGQLAVYDATLQDILVYPGAGRGVFFPGEVSPNHFIFVRDFKAWLYDAEKEETALLSGDLPKGLVLFAAPDAFSNVYCLVAPPLGSGGFRQLYRLRAAYPGALPALIDEIASASRGLASRFPAMAERLQELPLNVSIPIEGLPDCAWPPLLGAEGMSKVNEIGAEHGGIQFFFPTVRGDPLVFSTQDGGLYLYFDHPPFVCKLETNRPCALAAFPAIEPLQGRWVAWEDRELKQVFVLDRLTGCIAPVPFPNLLLAGCPEIVAAIPFFYRVDPFHLLVFVLLADRTYRVFSYNLQTEEILSLTLINDLLAAPACGRECLRQDLPDLIDLLLDRETLTQTPG